MATETDAARDRVLAARADARRGARDARGLGPRRGRHPGQDQAQPGEGRRGRGRRRRSSRSAARSGSSGRRKRAVRGPPKPLPKSMLPDEIEKTLRALGDDGDKVRGALERDFAAYAKQTAKATRASGRTLLLSTVARPLRWRGPPSRRRGGSSAPTTTTIARRGWRPIATVPSRQAVKARDAAAGRRPPPARREEGRRTESGNAGA